MFNTSSITYNKSNIGYAFHRHEQTGVTTENIRLYPGDTQTQTVAHEAFADITRARKITCNGVTFMDFSDSSLPTKDAQAYYAAIFSIVGDKLTTHAEKVALTSRIFSLFNQSIYAPLTLDVMQAYPGFGATGMNHSTTINARGNNVTVTRSIVFKLFNSKGEEFYVGTSVTIQGTKKNFIAGNTKKLKVKAYMTKPSDTIQGAEKKLLTKWI